MTHTDLCVFYNHFIFIEIPIMRLCLLRITATQLVSHMYEQDETALKQYIRDNITITLVFHVIILLK